MPLAITPTFSPWAHTSDDSYIYQLSLVLATATVSFIYIFIIYIFFYLGVGVLYLLFLFLILFFLQHTTHMSVFTFLFSTWDADEASGSGGGVRLVYSVAK